MNHHTLFSRVIIGGMVLILLLPLLHIPPLFDPAPWGKALVFRTILPLLALAFAAYVLAKGSVQWSELKNRSLGARTPLLLLGAFFLVSLVATLLSVDFSYSFWNTPLRAWGFLNYTFYLAFALLAFLFVKEKDWGLLLKTLFVTGAGISAVIFVQHFSLLPSLIAPQGRATGTLGSALFAGVFLSALIPLGLALLSRQRANAKRLAFGALLLAFFAALLFTGTRAALLGLGAGVLFFLLFFPERQPFLRRIALGSSLAAALLLLLVVFSSSLPFLSSLQRFQLSELLIDPRLGGWQIEFQGIADRPLLGYGSYNSFAGFNKHFDPQFLAQYGTTGWWDTAHSMYLDIAAGTGLIGLALFLLFVAVLFWKLDRARRMLSEHQKEILGVEAALLAYLVSMVSSFNTFSTYLLFFFLVAYAFFLIAQNPSGEKPEISFQRPENSRENRKQISDFSFLNRFLISNNRFLFVLTLLFVPLFLWFAYSTNLKPLLANKEINIAKAEAAADNCEAAVARMEKANPGDTFFADYYNGSYVDVIGKCISKLPGRPGELSQKAVDLLEQRARVRPLEPRVWILLGGYKNNLIMLSQDRAEQEQLANEALEAFAKAQELSPRRGEIFPKKMQTYRLVGKYKEAEQVGQECLVAVQEQQLLCKWELALTKISSGNTSGALELALEASERKAIQYLPEVALFQLAQAYQLHGARYLNEIIELYAALVLHNPANIQYRATLAEAYRAAGNKEGAAEQAVEIYRLNPTPDTKRQVEDFLDTLN